MFDCSHVSVCVCARVRVHCACICMCSDSFVSDSFEWMVRLCIYFAKWFEVWCSLLCCSFLFFVVVDLITYIGIGDRKRKELRNRGRQKSRHNKRNNQQKNHLVKISRSWKNKRNAFYVPCYCLSSTPHIMCTGIAMFSLFRFSFVFSFQWCAGNSIRHQQEHMYVYSAKIK